MVCIWAACICNVLKLCMCFQPYVSNQSQSQSTTPKPGSMAEIEQRLWNEFNIKVSGKSKAYKKQLLCGWHVNRKDVTK